MFKSVLIIIVVMVLLLVIRSVMQRFKPHNEKHPGELNRAAPINSSETVQCLQCKTYVPTEDAIINGKNTFCSAKHLNEWNHNT